MKPQVFDQWDIFGRGEALRHELPLNELTTISHKYMFRDDSLRTLLDARMLQLVYVGSITLVFASHENSWRQGVDSHNVIMVEHKRRVIEDMQDYKFSPFSNIGKQTYGGKIWSSSGLQLSSYLVLSESSVENALLSEISGYRKEYC
ncbi:hypothetical protein Tco_0158785 [Tanacetum coccineum]